MNQYTAVLSQYQDNAPVPTVLENTLGEVEMSRVGAGLYRLFCEGAFPDPMRIFWPNPLTLFDGGVIVGFVILQWVDADSIHIETYDASGSDKADGILEYFQPYRLEIRVYEQGLTQTER